MGCTKNSFIFITRSIFNTTSHIPESTWIFDSGSATHISGNYALYSDDIGDVELNTSFGNKKIVEGCSICTASYFQFYIDSEFEHSKSHDNI